MVPGDEIDNDCDTIIDEEIYDGKDDDDDNFIDEDIKSVMNKPVSISCLIFPEKR